MTSIATTLGVGSGIDTTALVTSLVAAARTPKETLIKKQQDANTAKISSLATINNAIDAFSSSLTTLVSGGTLFTQPSSSDSAILTTTAKAGARLGGLSAQIEVKAVATAQTLTAATVTGGGGAAAGTGTLTISRGGVDHVVTIDAANDTLAGLASAINAAGAGVTASILSDANGARLVVKGATGAANAFTITASEGGEAGLARFAYAGAGSAMSAAQVAADAVVKIDGVETTRATNSIDDLIDGVTIDLKKAAVGTSVTIGAVRPTAALSEAVGDFVAAYNEMTGVVKTATKASSDGADGGPLYGDSAVRALQQQLARLTSTTLAGGNSVSSLAEIGVSTNRDGTLSLDSARLSSVMTADPDGVEALFNPGQRSDNPLVRITSPLGRTKPGTYQLSNLVAQSGGTSASGTIAGYAAVTTGAALVATVLSPASGLVVVPAGDVASATVTVDLGLGGALQRLRDTMRASGGALASLQIRLDSTTRDLASRETDLVDKMTAYNDQLVKSFSAMDTRVAAYKATQAYLTQQVALWTKSDD